MLKLVTKLILLGILAASSVQPALGQHQDHAQPAQQAEKPVIFLDKSPRIVAYQLARLSNEQLLLVDRDTSDVKFVPVYQAILTRAGLGLEHRREAVLALAKLNQTDASTELLAALKTLKADQTAVAESLAKMLLSQDPADLKKRLTTLEETASTEGPDAARHSAFAALATIQPTEAVWGLAERSTGGAAQLFLGLTLVTDSARRASYFDKLSPFLDPAAEEQARRAAIMAASKMPGHEAAVFESLANLVAAGAGVPECARALAALPKDRWPESKLKPLAEALLEQAKKFPEAERTQNDFLDITQLGSDLAAKLPKEAGLEFRKAFRSLGVNVLRLRALHEQMFYDKTLLIVEAGKPVELIFENTDSMPHNWVLVLPGALEEIGRTADTMTPTLDSQGRAFVPASPKVLEATRLLNPGETVRLQFTAPRQPDKYPYVCTFPGHWMRMRGVLLVVEDLDAYFAQAPEEAPEPVFTEWKLPDLVADLRLLSEQRNLAKGQELFASLGCSGCHKLGGEGMPYGPDLSGIFAKYNGSVEAVLAEILQPSTIIEPRYRPHQFKPSEGESFNGFLIAEEGADLVIQLGPGEAAIQRFPKKSIVARTPQDQSLMPAGLLNLLNKEEIFDLLAYIKSAAATPAAQRQ